MLARNPMKDPAIAAKVSAAVAAKPEGWLKRSAEGMANIAAAARRRMSSGRNPMKDPAIARKVHARILHEIPQSKTDAWFESMMREHRIAVRFTGNGDFWINRRNPDFVALGQRAVIEVTQDGVFNMKAVQHRTPEGYGMDSLRHYAKQGWRCFVAFLPCHRKMQPHGLLTAIRSFLAGGESVVWRRGVSLGLGPSKQPPLFTT